MIIATSRPKNLKDVLTRTALPSHPKIDVQETVNKLKASLNMTQTTKEGISLTWLTDKSFLLTTQARKNYDPSKLHR